ncbi:MAG TPA: glycosyltransferase family A protein, partial [Chloroflexota bacterium]|nr:glycosyltransferase family A protein [Chloroflexota bacterium]
MAPGTFVCSVIVPAHNSARTIGECVMAVLTQSIARDAYELIVVDDGSTDRTVPIARRLGARVMTRSGLGVAAARNAGLRATQSDLVVFLDSDCLPR